MTTRFRDICALALVSVSLGLPGAVRAACPGIPCDCVGGAAGYRAVVLERLFGFGVVIYGDVCAGTAQLVERAGEMVPDDIDGDLHVLAGPGQVAVRARIPRPEPGDSIVVEGVLATGGGSVSGPLTTNTLDTSGTHPGIGECQQASADVQAASQTLAGLTPTQTLPNLVVDQGGTTFFNVGPGVNVIKVEGRIALRDGVLNIVLDPATDAVVFNAETLSMKRSTRIFVSGGDDTKVMINLPGPGPAVVARSDAWIAPVVFAPERTVRFKGARFAGVYGQRVQLRSTTTDFDTCPSPSGAFLETLEAF